MKDCFPDCVPGSAADASKDQARDANSLPPKADEQDSGLREVYDKYLNINKDPDSKNGLISSLTSEVQMNHPNDQVIGQMNDYFAKHHLQWSN